MNNRFILIICLVGGILFTLTVALPAVCAKPGTGLPLSANHIPTDMLTKVRVDKNYHRIPLTFEANQGQTDKQVKFLSRGRGYTLFLTTTEAVLVLRNRASKVSDRRSAGTPMANETDQPNQAVMRMNFVGANPSPQVMGLDELPGKSNYFISNDPKTWRTNVRNYAKVRYQDIYPGVDLICYGNQGQLEYDFIVAPSVRPSVINLAFSDVDELNIDDQGNLLVLTAGGTVVQKRPIVYQEIDGRRRFVTGRYVLKDRHSVGFSVGAYNLTKPLIIDPVLSYSTYLGGDGRESGRAIAVDSSGNIYMAGSTTSLNFPTTGGAFQSAYGGGTYDAFVTKMDPTVSSQGSLIYSTYLGGSGHDIGSGIAVDVSGNAYVLGDTTSVNFPTTAGAFHAALDGGLDAFVIKLNAAGSALLYSTYLGGSGSENGKGIAVDAGGITYVTGRTTSLDFPITAGAFQPAFVGGTEDAFVTRLNPAGFGAADLVYSTYLGGSGQRDEGTGIAVDGTGNAYVVGTTGSGDFPTTAGALQTGFTGGGNDAFVTRLNPAGLGAADLVYSTYLGSNDNDEGYDIAVDTTGNSYVTGVTFSLSFPTTTGAFQTAFGGGTDAFVSKINSTGSTLLYSTYLGGSRYEFGIGIAVDASGNAYATGDTTSTDFPTANAFQATCILNEYGLCQSDAFITKLNPTGSSLIHSSYLGGTGSDQGNDIAVDSVGNAYVTGYTQSVDFPTVNAFQSSFGGGFDDSFVAQILESTANAADLAITKTDSPDPVTVGDDITYTITVTNNGPDAPTDVIVTETLPSGVIFVSSSPSQGVCAGTSTVTCNLGTIDNGLSAAIDIVVTATVTGQLTNIASASSSLPDPDVTDNSATTSTTVDPVPGTEADLVLVKSDSPDPVTVGNNLTYTITVTNNGPQVANDVVLTDTLPADVSFVSSSPSQGSCTGTSTVTCDIGTITSGASATVTLVITPTTATILNNNASVTSSVGDPNGNNNHATTSTIVNASPSGAGANLIVTMSDSPDPVGGWGNVTYSITVRNDGPDPATSVLLRDMLSQEHDSGGYNYALALDSIVSVTPSQGNCSTSAFTFIRCAPFFGCLTYEGPLYVNCDLGFLASGATARVDIVLEAARGEGKIISNASVTNSEPDPDGSNNSTEQETTVGPFAPSGGGGGGGGGGG